MEGNVIQEKTKQNDVIVVQETRVHSQWPAVPSDGSGLADQVWKFAVSGVWQQHAAHSSHKAK